MITNTFIGTEKINPANTRRMLLIQNSSGNKLIQKTFSPDKLGNPYDCRITIRNFFSSEHNKCFQFTKAKQPIALIIINRMAGIPPIKKFDNSFKPKKSLGWEYCPDQLINLVGYPRKILNWFYTVIRLFGYLNCPNKAIIILSDVLTSININDRHSSCKITI